ncbi:MAG: hypothetical protein NTZ18_03945 [Candidatus Komeilibacteria bacterium]|nr:hypothetical protein [Candidatus Komeilibacteria bacterium]
MAFKNPKLNIKFFYALMAAIIILIVGLFGFTTYKKYLESFALSDNINKYLKSVSLREVEKDKAEAIIKFLAASSTEPINLAGVKNPFFPVPADEEKKK